jgi:hypothetical protein
VKISRIISNRKFVQITRRSAKPVCSGRDLSGIGVPPEAFHHVDLAAPRPPNVIEISAEQPDRRPCAWLAGAWKRCAYLKRAVTEGHLMLRPQLATCEL